MPDQCNRCGAEATKNCARCKSVFYCTKECQTTDWKKHKKACIASVLPPLQDKWGSSKLQLLTPPVIEELRKSCQGMPAHEADRLIYTACNKGDANYEAMVHMTLFPFGTGHFGSFTEANDSTFAEYANHLLRQATGNFLQNDMWLSYAVQIMANIRAIRGPAAGPPAASESNKLTTKEIQSINMASMVDAKKVFYYRYLVGDEDAYELCFFLMSAIQGQMKQGQR